MPMPRTKPLSTRPPEIRSAMAICSAMATGFSWMGRMLPSNRILARLVVRARMPAFMLTETPTHEGVLWCSLIIRPSQPTSSASTYSSR